MKDLVKGLRELSRIIFYEKYFSRNCICNFSFRANIANDDKDDIIILWLFIYLLKAHLKQIHNDFKFSFRVYITSFPLTQFALFWGTMEVWILIWMKKKDIKRLIKFTSNNKPPLIIRQKLIYSDCCFEMILL